ncbi:UBX domain-containing protein 6 [Papilio machaon]|uniref:UBX domain-containing protein 6 n=1 Tax=Papilio machaon TaxID=76193 RepID=A0A0N0PCS1_PAPMA|nr:UBX domain-containing protein 6 [Papilio machaon]
MADKIKKFFQKKKADAKFKLAGPGHKLTESTSQSSESSRKEVPVVRRSGLSQESKVAAEAALARLQQKRDNPAFNTSLAAIKAQVRKELENEKASETESTHTIPERKKSVEQEVDVPKNYAASGVFFKCPLISNEILPREEWKRNIKSFLYEQLEEERGLTACLIIQSCNNNREKIDTCVETLCKYLENIITYPEQEKYQKIRMSNRAFCERVQPIEGALELLLAAGFREETLLNPEGVEEQYMVFKKENVPSVESLTTLIDALRSAEPIQLELDRNVQVLLPSQAAHQLALPPAFYALSADELKREQQLRTEAIEKSQMLRTRAMREKDELREMRRYKFALIRVRFPDGILLQPIEGALELLLAAGFREETLLNPEGVEEQYMVFKKENVPSVESLTTLIDALRSAEPIQLELDRNVQVLLPSQAAHQLALPPAFYALSADELKREQQLRTEAIEKSQMLRTRAMREKDELREMRRYKFALIRVRFPDGILLQGTFSVYERYIEIHEFVQEHLEHGDLPFILNTPTGHKLIHDEDGTKTLIDLRLVPATVLTFSWDPSILEQINNSPNKDVYLKPEVMILVKEI